MRPRPGRTAPAAGSRPVSADPGQRRGAATHGSTRESRHDGPRIRRFRQFCRPGRVPPDRWAPSLSRMKRQQTQRHGATRRRSRTRLAPSRTKHLGCRKVAERGGAGESSVRNPCKMSGSAYGIRTRVTAVTVRVCPCQLLSSVAVSGLRCGGHGGSKSRERPICCPVSGGRATKRQQLDRDTRAARKVCAARSTLSSWKSSRPIAHQQARANVLMRKGPPAFGSYADCLILVSQQRASKRRRAAGVKGIVCSATPSAILLCNATPSVFHQRHIGRVLRSS